MRNQKRFGSNELFKVGELYFWLAQNIIKATEVE